MHKLFAAVWIATVKVMLGAFLCVFLLGAMGSIVTGEPVFDLMFDASKSSMAYMDELMNNMIGKIPFAGYVLDFIGVSANISTRGGYAVLHDFSKALMILLVTHVFFGAVRFVCRSKAEKDTFGIQLINGMGNMMLGLYAGLCVILFTMMLHEFLLDLWLEIFGNSWHANLTLLILMILLTIAVYLAVPFFLKGSLLESLFSLLIDFGLALCCAVEVCYIQLLYGSSQDNLIQGWEDVAAIFLPMVLCLVGLAVLVGIKLRNRTK